MITEDYVSFEIAKLLKEKGFDEPTMYHFSTDGTKRKFQQAHYIDDVAQPTLQMAIKWLRDVHNIHITILQVESTTITMEQEYFFYRIQKDRRSVGIFEDTFLKYEQAVESAIKYCLKNLI